jgi:hypothetical protein
MFNNQDIFNYGVKNFKALDPESIEEAIEDAVRACYNDFVHRFGLIHTAVTLENIGRMTAFTNGIPKVNLILDLDQTVISAEASEELDFKKYKTSYSISNRTHYRVNRGIDSSCCTR